MSQTKSSAAPPAPCAMVIIGAGGDLTERLLLPSLYNLELQGLVPENFAIIGVAVSDRDTAGWVAETDQFFQEMIKSPDSEFQAKSIDQSAWNRLKDCMSYFRGDISEADTFIALGQHIDEFDKKWGLAGNVLFYLALPEKFFGPTVDHLGAAGLLKQTEQYWRRVVIEKPFGHDLASAKALNADILRSAAESQIFRIDHFLGKETVQNIMTLRFGNGMFESLWNRDHIDHVQITVSETVGVEQRGGFYEPTGALRDMVPNHLFQMVAMLAMEAPASLDAEAIRDGKVAAIAAIRPVPPADAVRGQYTAGSVGGKQVVSYRNAPDVSPSSTTETYVALKLEIDNPRWSGVPFYLRTGKCMTSRSTEIALRFKNAALLPFPRASGCSGETWMVLQIQPTEGIEISFNNKLPGMTPTLTGVAMNFHYADWFKDPPPVGYEPLLYGALTGNAELFQRAEQVEAAWAALQPVLDAWAVKTDVIPFYEAGSAGPAEADDLLRRDNRQWRKLVGDA